MASRVAAHCGPLQNRTVSSSGWSSSRRFVVSACGGVVAGQPASDKRHALLDVRDDLALPVAPKVEHALSGRELIDKNFQGSWSRRSSSTPVGEV
jgi:hypothetical protein